MELKQKPEEKSGLDRDPVDETSEDIGLEVSENADNEL